MTFGNEQVPVVAVSTVVVGTGSAGYCAADRLWELGHDDIVMVADKVRAGASRNAGSDKQTYYKLTLSGSEPDSVREMAETLFSGGAMDGDNALAEAALSARGFIRLCDLGVPFPQNRYGEFVGYKTDHDPRQRATSVGPYTSRTMVEQLEKKVRRNGTQVLDECRVVDIVVHPDGHGGSRVAGLLVLRTNISSGSSESPFLFFRCQNIVYATGGPAGIYAKRVFPNGQWGASGAALRAGVIGKNLTEWQFGLGSIKPRWNVSGTYMQAIPRFVSTDAEGNDEREFLTEAIEDYGRLISLVFLKGYQWPFDARKAADGSSLIDLLVYQETALRGRRVFLDFRSNPVRTSFDHAELQPEAHEYLNRAGALFGTPIERLRHMNEPAYRFYLDRNPYIDLEKQMLEVDVCAQHNNGGLTVDAWWQSNVRGFFPVGEAAGSHGVYRPGGAALNSGQVGATRAAQFIAASDATPAHSEKEFIEAGTPILRAALDLLASATNRAEQGTPDNTGEMLSRVQELMSEKAGPVRSRHSILEALQQVSLWADEYSEVVSADRESRRSINRTFLVRDILTTAHVYLSAMADYIAHDGKSRGSVIYSDPSGSLPRRGYGSEPGKELALPDIFKFSLDNGALDDEVQETTLTSPLPLQALETSGTTTDRGAKPLPSKVEFNWRRRRPIPQDDEFFENVWRDFRANGNIY
ncbi:FAD-binding protein [Pseudarthrobacter sp. NamE5]|nr:FAD-binding protein [Pseudarthrobacter sp. NamE5]